MSSKDNFGDRMKMYERLETDQKFMPRLPVYVRLDGRGFSKFTKGMERPYDARMSSIMCQVTHDLVDTFSADVGYTQSDEISLLFKGTDTNEQFMFGAKKQKLISTLAAYASARFAVLAEKEFPEKFVGNYVPTFDCRIFQLPDEVEAVNAVIWREQDATKNSVSMAAHHYFSHNELQGKSATVMQGMLQTLKGVNWNDYPAFFKRGSYFMRKPIMVELSEEELEKIPAKHRPSGKVLRKRVMPLELPPMSRVKNKVDVLLYGEDPKQCKCGDCKCKQGVS
jgi:tRNA(His) 5'-end guanylyltransferase